MLEPLHRSNNWLLEQGLCKLVEHCQNWPFVRSDTKKAWRSRFRPIWVLRSYVDLCRNRDVSLKGWSARPYGPSVYVACKGFSDLLCNGPNQQAYCNNHWWIQCLISWWCTDIHSGQGANFRIWQKSGYNFGNTSLMSDIILVSM